MKCEYGCGLEAKFEIGQNKKWCCDERWELCPNMIKKKIESHKDKNKGKLIENIEGKLCDHCHEKVAKYQFRNGKLCCSEYTNLCSSLRKKLTNSSKGIKIENQEGKLCDHEGCVLKAKYQFRNGKLCCSDHSNSCPVIKKKLSKSHKGKKRGPSGPLSKEHRKKISIATKGKPKGSCSDEHKKNLSKTKKYSIKQWQEKYPFFAKIEELREDPITNEIQGHCKNHNCKNSKEQDGWFTLINSQIQYRAYHLENPNGIDSGYFYCCDECKQQCPLYNLQGDPFKIKKDSPYTDQEKNIWKQEVLQRQFDELGYNECEYCGNKELSELVVHHEKPQKTHPIMSLDPDNGIICCGYKAKNFCHMINGHKTGTECSTGYLSNIICT